MRQHSPESPLLTRVTRKPPLLALTERLRPSRQSRPVRNVARPNRPHASSGTSEMRSRTPAARSVDELPQKRVTMPTPRKRENEHARRDVRGARRLEKANATITTSTASGYVSSPESIASIIARGFKRRIAAVRVPLGSRTGAYSMNGTRAGVPSAGWCFYRAVCKPITETRGRRMRQRLNSWARGRNR